jgi:hypothetical protein
MKFNIHNYNLWTTITFRINMLSSNDFWMTCSKPEAKDTAEND